MVPNKKGARPAPKTASRQKYLHLLELSNRALLSNAVQGIMLVDAEDNIISFNDLAAKQIKDITGARPSEGDSFEKLLLQKEFSVFKTNYQTALTGKGVTVQRTVTDKRKRERTFTVSLAPIPAKGRIECISVSMLEVTEQRKTEQEIERLSWVASHTNSSVSITDAHGKIQWVNKSFEKLTGYTMDEVMGRNPGEVLQGKGTDRKTVKRISESLAKHEASTGEIILNYTKSGEPVWISADITPIFRDGVLINFIGIVTDLTDMMTAREMQEQQRVLQEQQQLFNSIATYFPNGVIGILDRHLHYVFVGGTDLHKLGLDHHKMIGDKIFDKIHPESNVLAEPYLRQALEGENASFELTISGNAYQVIAVPIRNDNAPVSQVLVVIYNVTEQKKVEETLKKVIEKQAQLNDMKTKFVSMASHEFRTPLSTILSSSGLVEKYNKPEDAPKREKHLARIKSSVHNLTDILNDFLTLGKMEDGGVKNNPVLFDLNEFFSDLMEEMRANVKPGQLIKFAYSGDVDAVCLDAKHLKNVMLNLMSNAIKYSPDGKTIHLTVHSDNNGLRLEVRDEGIGIPVEDQEHLFSTFYRANNVTNIQGTGMGLHIVKKYLELMGGSISFVSELDRGTTFTVSFPPAAIVIS